MLILWADEEREIAKTTASEKMKQAHLFWIWFFPLLNDMGFSAGIIRTELLMIGEYTE